MLVPTDLTLDTRRLRLRYPTEADIPHIFAASRHPGFTDGMQWEPPSTPAELYAPLRANEEAWAAGTGYAFTLELAEVFLFVGRIGIRQTERDGVWNIGFWTHPVYQGQGYMTEAIAAIVSFGFNTLGATRIEADYATWNVASARVLERSGFVFVREVQKGYRKRGAWQVTHVVAREK